MTSRPIARVASLVVAEAGDDTLVYDLATHHAHSLDAHAARLWRLCDGTRDERALAEATRDADDLSAQLEVVRYTLGRLAAAGLLVPDSAATVHADARPMSRRALVRRLAAAGATAIVVPAVLSVVAPTTLQAQASCVGGGFNCFKAGGPGCCPPFNCLPSGTGGANKCL